MRYRPPTPYDGSLETLRGFLTQSRVYLQYHLDQLPLDSDKVILIASFLKEDALTWFEPIIRDFIENDKDDWNEDIKKLYEDYNEFEQALKEAFGNPDEEREAERRLQNLR